LHDGSGSCDEVCNDRSGNATDDKYRIRAEANFPMLGPVAPNRSKSAGVTILSMPATLLLAPESCQASLSPARGFLQTFGQ
jgi:hypothetical protein